jgi:hypothetical protein
LIGTCSSLCSARLLACTIKNIDVCINLVSSPFYQADIVASIANLGAIHGCSDLARAQLGIQAVNAGLFVIGQGGSGFVEATSLSDASIGLRDDFLQPFLLG